MIGTTVSHYRVRSRLGAGGMGEVWLAEDIRLGHKVAVKFLLPHLAGDREARARFLTEATAISQLQHQSIVPLLECDERDGQLFIITPYCPGGSLRDAMKVKGREGLPTELALSWGQSIAEGLAEAHGRGILHRDIKPENLLLSDREELRICDFGLARLVDATQITRTATTLGTVGYMSPEQVRGETADERSDVWSLGVVLFEMATGKRPFDRGNMQATMLAITTDAAAQADSLRDGLPEEFSWIIAKCLQKDADDRYASAKELADDLAAVSKAAGGDATVRLKAARPSRGRPRLWPSVIGISLVVGLIAAGLLWWQPHRADEPADPSAELTPPEVSGPPRLIVARIENHTGIAEYDATTELVTERLAQNLSTTGLVEVIPLSGVLSAMQGLDLSPSGEMSDVTLRALSEETDARVVITGAIFDSGNRLQIQGRIAEFPGGRIIATIPIIETDPAELDFAVREFEQRVMGGVAMYADNPLRQPLPTVSPRFDAYEAYAEGLSGFDRSWRQLGMFDQNMEPFRRAVALDSTFSRAAVQSLLIANAFDQGGKAKLLFDEITDSGLEFDKYDSILLEFLKYDISGQRTESLGYAQQLHELYPDDMVSGILLFAACNRNQLPARSVEVFETLRMPTTMRRRLFGALQLVNLSGAYHAIRDHETEARTCDEMSEYYPNLLLFNLNHARPYAALGDSARVTEIVTRVLGMPGSRGQFDYMVWQVCDIFRAHGNPAMGVDLANFYLAQRADEGNDTHLRNNKGMLLLRAERLDEAHELFESSIADSIQTGTARLLLGSLAARRGDTEFAQQIIDEDIVPWLEQADSQGTAEVWRARFAALSGESEQAMRWLREASRKGKTPGVSWRHEPDFESLLGYAPFEELVRPRG